VTYSRCVAIWVTKDFAIARGWFQGYPKKLGNIAVTRVFNNGQATPKLEPGAKLVFTQGFTERPRESAFLARSPAPIRTEGFEVFVQLVIAAITIAP
jgi:hypothetical protein